MLARDLELVVIDECCFTWRGYKRMEWAHKGENLELYKRAGQKNYQCVACCGAISLAGGKELMVFRGRSFNGSQFLDYLKQLHASLRGRKYALYVDNCSIHKTLAVRAWAAEEGVEFVLGVPYCPQYCAIENFWAGAKRTFRQLGTKVILAGQPRDLMSEAQQSVFAQSDQFAKNCSAGGIKAILNIMLPGDTDDIE